MPVEWRKRPCGARLGRGGARRGVAGAWQNFLQLRQRLDTADKHTYLKRSITTPAGAIQEEACSVIK